jgi:hypothetical protein
MDILRKQFQYHRAERIFSRVIGPEFKSYWPNRNREVINMTKSLYSAEIPLRNISILGSEFSKIVRQLPMTTTELYRENMIEWKSRRGGNKKK